MAGHGWCRQRVDIILMHVLDHFDVLGVVDCNVDQNRYGLLQHHTWHRALRNGGADDVALAAESPCNNINIITFHLNVSGAAVMGLFLEGHHVVGSADKDQVPKPASKANGRALDAGE